MRVNIPDPCHENWNKMSPEGQGRFCNACEKIVVDFTNKKPLEIKEMLMQNTGKVCGRFKKSDLDKPLEEPVPVMPEKTSWFRKKWMAVVAGVAVVFAGKKAQAQEDSIVGKVMKLPAETENKTLSCKPAATVIHGIIGSTNKVTGLSEVQITVYSNGQLIQHKLVFDNDKYFLTVPEHTIWDFKITIEYNAVGYQTKVLYDVPVNKDLIAMDILMVPLSEEALAGLVPQFVAETYTMGIVAEPPQPSIHPPEEVVAGLIEVDDRWMVTYDAPPIDSTKKTTIEYTAPEPEKVVENVVSILTIKAYPNPGSGLFNINIHNSNQSEIFVYDLSGKMVLSKKTTTGLEIIDITNQPNGTYLVKVVSLEHNRAQQLKLVKMN